MSSNRLVTRSFALCLLAFLAVSAAAQRRQPDPAAEQDDFHYQDIFLRDLPDRLEFGNAKLQLAFGKQQGEWLSLQAEGLPGNVIAPTHAPVAVDFRIGDVWMIEQNGARLLRRTVAINQAKGGVTLSLFLGVGPMSSQWNLIPDQWRARTDRSGAQPPPAYEFDFVVEYTIFPGEGRIERAARLTRNAGQNLLNFDSRKLEGFLFQLPGAAAGDPAECSVDIPGPFFPASYVPPHVAYNKLLNRYQSFHSAPESGFGLFTVTNTARNMSIGSWMDTKGDVAYLSYLSSDGKRITFLHYGLRATRLFRRTTVPSDTHHVQVVAGPTQAILAEYRRVAEKSMPLDIRTPAWARQMIVLEVMPAYFPDRLKGLTKKLPFYKDVGFNTIYLMPHYLGGYSPIDPFAVDPAFGTAADLKEMVRTAHALGMHVIFDMVIHGFNARSPVVKEHPELFVHDEQGFIVPHATWNSMSTDWAAPAYWKYMVDYVQHDIKEYDIDGYRVDAATYKSPNWDPRIPYEAWRSSAARDLLSRMMSAMRELKPEAVLLSEVFGPLFHSISNSVHDNQTEAVQFLLDKMAAGESTAVDYKAHMADVYDALPAGANRVYYARNHDTSWFFHFGGYTPRFMAMEAIHTFFAIPEVFAGDSNNPPSPDTDPAVYDYYRRLFKLRRDFAELSVGEELMRDVECDNPMVFTAMRKLDAQVSVVAVSLSDRAETVKLSGRLPGNLKWIDAISGARVEVAGPVLKLKPFQVLVGRM